MSLEQGRSEPADDSDTEVFEIVLPITVLVLSDDDFLHEDAEKQAGSVAESEEDGQEVNLSDGVDLEGKVAPSSCSDSLSIWEENKYAFSKYNSVTCSEEKQVAESVCNIPKSSLSDGCDTGTDKYSENCALPTSSCEAELTEGNETSDRKPCDGDDSFHEIPPLFSAGTEGRDGTKASRHLTLAAISQHEEELLSVASVLSDGSQEKQPEVHKELEATVEMEDTDPSKNGDNEANNSKSKRIKFEDETLSSLLEHDLKEEPEFTYNCSAPFLNGCSTSEGLLNEVGKLEMNASTSAESDTPDELIYRTLKPLPKKRCEQQRVVSPHASPKELQSQQEGLVWLSNSVTIKTLSRESCSINKRERLNLKCRFCSSVYKCNVHLKKHLYSAHKDKKIHKCCFCKRTFFFSVSLKNHLKFHKKMNGLQKSIKNRMTVRKVRQRRSEKGKSETKKKVSKYEKLFMKIERNFTPLGVPASFTCKICFFASPNPRVFFNHMKGHKERPPYQCPQCDYSCISLCYLLNHMYWHAGYKLYQCRFCTFFSLYFSSMVRHSYLHTGAKPYACKVCPSAFRSPAGLKRHRRVHAEKETCQEQQPDLVSGRKKMQRPLKNYTCDECNMVSYSRGNTSFHKKFHGQLKATANGYMNQSYEYHESKICEAESDCQDDVSLSPSSKENYCLSGGMLASEVDFEQAGDVQDNKDMYSGKKSPENSHESNSLLIIGNRSEVSLNSYTKDTAFSKEEPLFNSKASHSEVQDDDTYHRFVENLKSTWPSNLSAFKMYKCQHCNYTTTVQSNFKLHLRVHTDERPFGCKEGNKTFKTSNHFQKHSLNHIKNRYEFGHCFCVDSHSENLELHQEMRVGLCPERDIGSSEDSKIVRSLLGSEVSGVQPDVQRGKENDSLAQSQLQFYQCAECEYATRNLSNFVLHVRTHTGEKPYSCSVCQKKFRTSGHLKRHGITHYSVHHLKCGNCDYSTNKWLSLKQHLASHSPEGSSSPGCFYKQQLLPIKTYTCEECSYSTVHSGNLKLHLRIHTGEKPFKCSQCAVAFRTSSHLKRHLLTHLKLQCRRCRFATTDKCAFQKHLKTHVKKYKCGNCNVILPTRKLLEKHKQQHELGI